ncbi:J domain-containing protein [uncultured Stenotrophomonas sp.]|uniref:J domain-containing protein n=1 Tax=uncultured Stenotrophomonas sp. TaxID=165438 RepID=UPI000DB62DFA|nr:J domain-containing protein [uncultured Stenotrophomonas sp.]PZU30264.1 MAG: molecular chaperone DnaJ [Stenotrophomonas sp.]
MADENHYEVLGVRPEAPLWEIELAYKGRRSQYHPDRYSAGDESAVAWATARMQAVNKAYVVLKDPEKRERFDRAQASASTKAGPAPKPTPEPRPQQARPAQPPPLRSLRQALEGLEFTNEPFERVFVAPHIPRKKLLGALDSYGGGIRAQDVVALIDDTVFGGAREGALITEAQIRSKAKFEGVEIRLLSCLTQITAHGAHIRIHGEHYASLSIPNPDDLRTLFVAVSRYLQETN